MGIDVFFATLVAAIIVQRLIELAISRRNEKWLREQGAQEIGRKHYKYIVLLHIAFFVALTGEVVYFKRGRPDWWIVPFLALLLAQGLRVWSQISLKRLWTTRILIAPKHRIVTTGIYRYCRHPSYLAAAIEILAVPLIFQAYVTAAVFTLLNIAVMAVRIPAEQKALSFAMTRDPRPTP